MDSVLDHLVVVVPHLDVGSEFIREQLGVELVPGGRHMSMGTHNNLLRLGHRLYLEVIAIDPSATHPGRPRWFGLDHATASFVPLLANWVVRTDGLEQISHAFPDIVGEVNPMARGSLNWKITIPADGTLPLAGAAPTLIQWAESVHPVDALEDSGCSLVALDVFHPTPELISHLLTSMDFTGPVRLHQLSANEPARLSAQIQTPRGLKYL